MLHYAMVTFAGSVLHDSESLVWAYPSLPATLALVRRYGLSRRRRHLLTKRGYRWFMPDEVDRLIYSTLKYRMFLINIVRDPRDVLTSQKRGHDGHYVKPDRWQRSVEAAEVILRALEGYPDQLTLRYEDIVTDADRAGRTLMDRIGLQLRPHITSWANLADNMALLGQNIGRVGAMHRLRNFDPSSVGRWRHDPAKARFLAELLDSSPYGAPLRRFMATYDYPFDEVASV
jgi:hypothetical protein